MTLRTALDQGTEILDKGGVGAPRLTAEVLLSHALRCERVWLFSHRDDELTEIAWIHYGRYLHQRLQGIPTQYITKKQEFYGREFRVGPAVLIPRPETEHLVAAALERLNSGDVVLDVGTGSGAIAVTLALERPQLRALAVDISVDALAVASCNATHLSARVGFFRSDLTAAVRPTSVSAIVSNPPYVGLDERDSLQREVRDNEPSVALFAGKNGNAIYQRLVDDAGRVLRLNGWLLLELGYRSLDAVRAMLDARWTDVEAIPDLAGIPRVLAARWTP